MRRYNPKEIEPKWQKIWEESKVYSAELNSKKTKYIGFGMFNYPSGAGIHVGHARNYTIPDVITRIKRQQGFESYQPVGWDAFGLPAENYAIQTGVSPQESTAKAIDKYRQQYRAMGWAVDWEKEITTSDPKYYKWTQWTFSKLFENGLAYQKESPQWWCPHDKTVLADEQVIDGKCWRCGHVVERKSLKQWFFKITQYADEMLAATDDLDWTEAVKASQKAWIGRSQGATIKFKIEGSKEEIEVFTTRADTIFSAAFLVLAPEHPLVAKLSQPEQKTDVEAYINESLTKTDIERQQDEKAKTGVFTGSYAVNPANGQKIPIWAADFVLASYGTGAVFGDVHDERDFEFVKKYEIPAEPTVIPEDESEAQKVKNKEYPYTGEGILINSGEFSGQRSEEARDKIIAWLAEKGMAAETVNYKMRDWLISRQRYWGAPIPIIHCPKDGPVLVPEKDLPVVLPKVENYEPTGGNVSVLAGVEDWVNVKCPECGGPAKRETDTMDGYVCSSWYFLRYLSPHDDKEAWQPALAEKWLPIDFYNGADHATAHLLYARFYTRFFHKLGLTGTPEPFAKMVYNGKVKASDGSAFSKSKGNGVDPLEIIDSGYGADALRMYLIFAAPVEFDVLWDPQGVPGTYRFLNRVWNLVQEYLEAPEGNNDMQSTALARAAGKAARKITKQIESGRLNTAVASLMELSNEYYALKDKTGLSHSDGWRQAIETLIQLLAPFAPHIAEEMWQSLGNEQSVHLGPWPSWDDELIKDDMITIAVQINGKVRAEILVEAEAAEEEVIAAAKQDSKAAAYLKDQTVKKTIYVPGRLVSFVV